MLFACLFVHVCLCHYRKNSAFLFISCANSTLFTSCFIWMAKNKRWQQQMNQRKQPRWRAKAYTNSQHSSVWYSIRLCCWFSLRFYLESSFFNYLVWCLAACTFARCFRLIFHLNNANMRITHAWWKIRSSKLKTDVDEKKNYRKMVTEPTDEGKKAKKKERMHTRDNL